MIIKRGKTWTYSIDLGWEPDENGEQRRKRKWKGGFATKREAQEAYEEHKTQLKRGEYVAPSRITVREYLVDVWLPGLNLADSTLANYEHQVHSYLLPRIGHRKLQDLSTAELDRLYNELQRDGRRQSEGGLSAKSTRNVHGVLRKALNDAVRWNYLARNPASDAKPPTPDTREMKIWTPDQVKEFLEAEQDTREFPIWRLAVTTGMRRGEVLGLSWDAVNLKTGRLSIYQTLVNVSNVPTLDPRTKTKSSRRMVNLDSTTVTTLNKHQSNQYQERLLAGEAWNNESNLVFVNEIGEMMKPERVTRIFNARVRAAGLPPIRFHDMRHTWASNALQAGVHVKVVSERLGHSKVGMTLDVYSHTIPSMDEEAAETVAALYA